MNSIKHPHVIFPILLCLNVCLVEIKPAMGESSLVEQIEQRIKEGKQTDTTRPTNLNSPLTPNFPNQVPEPRPYFSPEYSIPITDDLPVELNTTNESAFKQIDEYVSKRAFALCFLEHLLADIQTENNTRYNYTVIQLTNRYMVRYDDSGFLEGLKIDTPLGQELVRIAHRRSIKKKEELCPRVIER